MRRALVAFAMVLVACNGSGGGPDGPPAPGDGDGGPLTCMQLATQLRDLATDVVSHACETAGDCTAVGYPVDLTGYPTCNCGVAFSSSCGGIAVNAQAWHDDPTVEPLLDEWTTRCVRVGGGGTSGAPGICDCSWEPSSIDCIDNRCFTDYLGRSCFPVPDASPDSSPADAAIDS